VKSIENSADLLPRQHDWEALGPLGPDDVVEPGQIVFQDFAVKEKERAQRLVLRGRRDLLLDGQRAQELRDLGRSHLRGVTLAVEEDIAPDPGDGGLLGATAVVPSPDGFSHAVEQSSFRRSGRSCLMDGQGPAEDCAGKRRIRDRGIRLKGDHAHAPSAPGPRT
jgi:hypothetical protein